MTQALTTEHRTPKIVASGADARGKLASAIDEAGRIIGSTFGPSGHVVALPHPYSPPKLTKDGVTVASFLSSKDPHTEHGFRLLKSAASQANAVAGDGTTTTAILASAITRFGVDEISRRVAPNPPINSNQMVRGMERAIERACGRLEALAVGGDNDAAVVTVATCAANNDAVIGKQIAEAVQAAGENGVVTIEESAKTGVSFETVNGAKIDKGMAIPQFMTNMRRLRAELKSPLVFVSTGTLATTEGLQKLLQYAKQEGRPIVLIADDFNPTLLGELLRFRDQAGLVSVPVPAPGRGERQQELLMDLAILAGAMLHDQKNGHRDRDIGVASLGSFESAQIGLKDSVFVRADTDESPNLSDRVEMLQTMLTEAESDYETEQIKGRLATLTGGVSRILVGAGSDEALIELMDRVEDAKNAALAAISDGVVPGCGAGMVLAAEAVSADMRTVDMEAQRDFWTGMRIVKDALTVPFQRLMENGGHSPADMLRTLYAEQRADESRTFNALTGEWGDAAEMGVLVPTLVETTSLRQAGSLAGLVLRLEHSVAFDPDTKTE